MIPQKAKTPPKKQMWAKSRDEDGLKRVPLTKLQGQTKLDAPSSSVLMELLHSHRAHVSRDGTATDVCPPGEGVVPGAEFWSGMVDLNC